MPREENQNSESLNEVEEHHMDGQHNRIPRDADDSIQSEFTEVVTDIENILESGVLGEETEHSQHNAEEESGGGNDFEINSEEPEVTPHDEPIFSLYTKLFFDEEKATVVNRIIDVGGNNVTSDLIETFYDLLLTNFSGSGEHFKDEQYLKIIKTIYPEQELFDKLSDAFKEVLIWKLEDNVLQEEGVMEIKAKICNLFPGFEELSRSEE